MEFFNSSAVKNTSEKLDFYHICPEGARSYANMEINHSKNVSIYGMKSEGNSIILLVKDSDHIRVFGYGGNASASEGSSLFRIENTLNFILANIVDHPMPHGKKAIRHAVGVDGKKWFMIIEKTPEGKIIKTTPLDRPVLYKRGKIRE